VKWWSTWQVVESESVREWERGLGCLRGRRTVWLGLALIRQSGGVRRLQVPVVPDVLGVLVVRLLRLARCAKDLGVKYKLLY
jgi:hypothetical protein